MKEKEFSEPRNSVKVESHYVQENNFFNDDSIEENNEMEDEALQIDEQIIEPTSESATIEERNMVLMEKLVSIKTFKLQVVKINLT